MSTATTNALYLRGTSCSSCFYFLSSSYCTATSSSSGSCGEARRNTPEWQAGRLLGAIVFYCTYIFLRIIVIIMSECLAFNRLAFIDRPTHANMSTAMLWISRSPFRFDCVSVCDAPMSRRPSAKLSRVLLGWMATWLHAHLCESYTHAKRMLCHPSTQNVVDNLSRNINLHINCDDFRSAKHDEFKIKN